MWGQQWTPPSGGIGGSSFSPVSFGPVDPNACCAPVTIYDGVTGAVIAIIESGGTYTTNPQTFTRTITFKAGCIGAVSFVSIAAGNIRVVSSSNITSAVYKNRTTGFTLIPPYHVNSQDIITIDIVHTNIALDAVLVLEGVFDSVSVSVIDPNLGGDGRFRYQLNEPDRTISVIDVSTDTISATTATFNAASTFTSIAYRGINDTVYVWGFLNANTTTFSLQKLDCTNNTLAAVQTFTAFNIGFNPVCAAYNYIRDVFYIVGGGGAGCPIVIFDPVTDTFVSTVLIDLVSTVGLYYMGYADVFEDSFFVCGGQLAVSMCYKQITTSTFALKGGAIRTGPAMVAFNRTNRLWYSTDTNGGIYWRNTTSLPSVGNGGSVNMRRAGICHNYVQNKIAACDITARAYAVWDVVGVSSNAFTPAAVGAETGFRCMDYSDYSGKIYMSSCNGNIVHVISPTTDAIVATITVGNQKTIAGGSFNQSCYRRVKLF